MRREIIASARSCVGVRFRPQGRDPATGLDCVGVAIIAYGTRLRGRLPADYAQRGGSLATIRDLAASVGLRPIDPAGAGAGDLLLVMTGPAQWHLAVLTDEGFIHADAAMRRVTEVPDPPPWPAAGAWTANEET